MNERTGTGGTGEKRVEVVELRRKLAALRADLVGQMAARLEHEGDWHAWLPLLAQAQVCIQAVEAVAEARPDTFIEDFLS